MFTNSGHQNKYYRAKLTKKARKSYQTAKGNNLIALAALQIVKKQYIKNSIILKQGVKISPFIFSYRRNKFRTND